MSFRPIISRWRTKAALAADLQVKHGIVQAWWNRDSIPGDWDVALVRAAAARGFGVSGENGEPAITVEALAAIRAGRRAPPLPAIQAEAVPC